MNQTMSNQELRFMVVSITTLSLMAWFAAIRWILSLIFGA